MVVAIYGYAYLIGGHGSPFQFVSVLISIEEAAQYDTVNSIY
jgi:hypothetical protein